MAANKQGKMVSPPRSLGAIPDYVPQMAVANFFCLGQPRKFE